MSEFLLYYQRPNPATWVYLSSFLSIGLYFVFHRFWSVRNVDIVLLILLGPGVLMVHEGRRQQLAAALEERQGPGLATSAAASDGDAVSLVARPVVEDLQVVSESVPMELAETPTDTREQAETSEVAGEGAAVQLRRDQEEEASLEEGEGTSASSGEGWLVSPVEITSAERLELRGFYWLLGTELVILIRLLLDPLMVRRPLLDPNLTTGGLAFIGISLLIFLMANVITSTPRMQREQGPELGPGYPVLNMLPAIPTTPDGGSALLLRGDDDFAGAGDATAIGLRSAEPTSPPVAYTALARTIAIFAHLAVVIGIALIGYWHFGNFRAGVGCATLYLLLPYTAQMTGRVDHVLPAALLVGAILFYRRPLLAGTCLGLAAGLVYYPAFLLPLWFGFYRQRGMGRFAIGVGLTLLMLTMLLWVGGTEKFTERLVQMYGLWFPLRENLVGVWGLGWQPIWRLPILVAFVLLAFFYSVWPRQKNLGTLMSCSATLMVAAQFWHGFGGGLFIAWFLPLFLLTIFRPNLEDRVALKVIGSGSWRRGVPGGVGIDAAVLLLALLPAGLAVTGLPHFFQV